MELIDITSILGACDQAAAAAVSLCPSVTVTYQGFGVEAFGNQPGERSVMEQATDRGPIPMYLASWRVFSD